jgi:hypothetical protein
VPIFRGAAAWALRSGAAAQAGEFLEQLGDALGVFDHVAGTCVLRPALVAHGDPELAGPERTMMGNTRRNRIIAVAGYRLQLPVLAGVVFGEIVEKAADVGSTEFPMVAVQGARGFVEKPGGPQRASRRYWGIFQQGTFVFTVVVASAATDDRDLVLTQRLTQLQAAKGPGTPSVRLSRISWKLR